MAIKQKIKISFLIVFFVVAGSVVSYGELPSFGYNDGYQPVQPIPYDHSLHAGKYQIPCLHCHVQADKNRHATVPSLNICLNCHRTVATDKTSIQQITEAHTKGLSIPWIKVTMLPDYVMFNHEAHVTKGVRCQKCHGEVQEMKEVSQKMPLTMGWCVNCHREPAAAVDLGWDKKKEVKEVIQQAPTSCGTCHY